MTWSQRGGQRRGRFGIAVVPVVTAVLFELVAVQAAAQTIGGDGPAGDTNAPPAPNAPQAGATTSAPGNTTVNVTPAPAQATTTTTYSAIGLPAPGTNVDQHLPSSSRASTDASRSADGFDLLPNENAGGIVKGNADAGGVVSTKSSSVPALHQVRRGDTLWDLCSGYFQNPWLWPKVWSYNPQIQNPHWIYPGDQVRLRTDMPAAQRASITLGANSNLRGAQGGPGTGGFSIRRQMVDKDTVFLRNIGYIDDPKKDVWGELVGAQEEQQLLTEGNSSYVILRPGVDTKIGQLLTVFRSIRTPAKVPGARRPPGEIVAFRGTVRVESWNPKTRIARAAVVESLDTIERGDKIGPVGRRFEVIPPRANTVDLEARVLTSLYPHEVVGQNQIAFIDRGSRDGLVAGNRLFLVERGDVWRHTLVTATREARTRISTDTPEHVQAEVAPLEGKDEDFPEEVVGEVRVLRADEYSSVTLITSSKHEIEPGDRLVARQGY
jgi:hypothetical protein